MPIMLYYLYKEDVMDVQIRNVPDGVHREFRILCLKQGISMTQKIIRLMIKAIDEEHKK